MSYKDLKIISQKEAIRRANEEIKRSMKDRYPGVISRWPKLNQVVGGAFRFGQTFYILGASGSGKSYFLNMLRDDFASNINYGYPYTFKILSFSFEMSAADEIIRTYSGRLEKSYSDLISANGKITDEDYNSVLDTSKSVENDKTFYVEASGNRDQIMNTVNRAAA